MREVDGTKVAFIDHDVYFGSIYTSSMVSTQMNTGADVVLLLAPGKTEQNVTDDEIREVFKALATKNDT